MSREIKFRAFVKPILRFANRQVGFMIDVSEIDFNEKYVANDDGTVYYFDEIELVQYAGLKDKNGVEIYEGDIIGLDGFWSYYIDFHDGAFRKIPCNQAQKLNWPWNPLEKVTIEVHGWEVIGNRYENSELLKEVTE